MPSEQSCLPSQVSVIGKQNPSPHSNSLSEQAEIKSQSYVFTFFPYGHDNIGNVEMFNNPGKTIFANTIVHYTMILGCGI